MAQDAKLTHTPSLGTQVLGVETLKNAAVGSTVCLDAHYGAALCGAPLTGYTVLRKTRGGYVVEQQKPGFVPTHSSLANGGPKN